MVNSARFSGKYISLKRTLLGMCCVLGMQSQAAVATENFKVNRHGNAIISLGDTSGLSLEVLPGAKPDELAYTLTGDALLETSGVLSGVTGNLIIRSNSDNGSVVLDGVSLPGDLRIITGKRRDNIGLYNVSVKNNMRIVTGSGNDDIRADKVAVGGHVMVYSQQGNDDVILASITAEKNFIVSTGRGRDDVGLSTGFGGPLGSGGKTIIRTGGGNDEVSLTGYNAEKDFIINTGNNRDVVEINASMFLDGARISLGNGKDVLEIEATDISGKQAVFNGANGNDTYRDRGENLFFSGKPKIVHFEKIIEEPTEPPVVTYAIGDTGPGGGIVFDVNDDGTSGMEISLRTPLSANGQSWGCIFRNVEGINDSPDGVNVDDMFGVTSPDPQTGADKTSVIEFQTCSTLANTSDNFVSNGLSGWFLPSASELLLAVNSGAMQQLLPGVQAYWTSSEQSDLSAFLVLDNMGVGEISPASKQTSATHAVARSFAP